MRTSDSANLWLGFLAFLMLLGLCVHRADAATIDGTFALPTKYVDGSNLPVANIKHIRVQVGTCNGAAFGTVEGTQLVVPPATVFAVVVPRPFGEFCVQAQTETTLGTLSDFVGPARVTKVEPKPNPPTLVTVNIVAYETQWNPGRGTVIGRAVGTVALGTACGSQRIARQGQRQFYEVPLDVVDLSVLPASAIVVAQCEARS